MFETFLLLWYNLDMQQYFSNKKENNILYFDSEDLHHIKNVMRIKEESEVIVNFEGTSYICKMCEDLKSASIISVYKTKEEGPVVTAYIPVLNDEKTSFIIEKCTELGVNNFILVQYERCKFIINKDKLEKKLMRYNKIAKEASEQSRRTSVPKVTGVIKVDSIESSSGVNILCSLDEYNVKSINKVLNSNSICDKINIVFGPEGGLTNKKGDFFLIFLIIMMIVILSVIIYLIKLQINEKYYYDNEEDVDDDFIDKFENKEELPVNESMKKEPITETIKETPRLVNQTKFDFEKNDVVDSIKSYETDQEEMAIISASELESRIKNMKETGEYEKHFDKINEYESDQENQAIISYDELLRRASSNNISYESEENLGGIKVSKVDTSKIEIKSEESNKPYYREESFLNALKEFRESL